MLLMSITNHCSHYLVLMWMNRGRNYIILATSGEKNCRPFHTHKQKCAPWLRARMMKRQKITRLQRPVHGEERSRSAMISDSGSCWHLTLITWDSWLLQCPQWCFTASWTPQSSVFVLYKQCMNKKIRRYDFGLQLNKEAVYPRCPLFYPATPDASLHTDWRPKRLRFK